MGSLSAILSKLLLHQNLEQNAQPEKQQLLQLIRLHQTIRLQPQKQELLLVLIRILPSDSSSISSTEPVSSDVAQIPSVRLCWVRSKVFRLFFWQEFQVVSSQMCLSCLSSCSLAKVVLVLGLCPLDPSTWELSVLLSLSLLVLLNLVAV